jgi:hypothetical protein
MNYAGTITTVFLIILLAALPGCDSKKEKAAQAPPHKADQPQSPQKASAVVAAPRDKADAVAVKSRVLGQIKRGEFAVIYKDASAGFREVGTEQQFLAQWSKQLQETGAFKEAKEISHTVIPEDGFQEFKYNVRYENKTKELRLTFGRSKKGKMELTGFHQKDVK